jgi:ubiquinone/menaquinone biosynthesis C-methylase UbiE
MGPNQAQRDAWNGSESVHYVDHADRYDRQLEPITAAVLERAALRRDEVVLDVGCGSGAMALAAAPAARRVVGVDISEPLTAVAVDRARREGFSNAEFVVADAQTHAFDEGSFDVLLSQFGLMFFDDPVTAFSNLRRAMVPGGRVVFAGWRALGDNEWLAPVVAAVAEFADVPDLGGLAAGGGMFAFKDRSEIVDLLDRVGFREAAVEPISPVVVLGGGGDVAEAASFLFGMGIVRGLLSRLDDGQRGRATARIRAELEDRYEPGVGVPLGAAAWLVTARA